MIFGWWGTGRRFALRQIWMFLFSTFFTSIGNDDSVPTIHSGRQSQTERERVDGFHEPRTKQNENTEIYYDFDMQSSFHLVLNSLLWVWFSMKQKIRRPYEAFSERMEINTIGTVFVVNECIWICQLYNGNKIMWRCNDGIGKQ